MAFNNDVTTTKLFGQVYTLLTGAQSDGFTVLEVSYSVGIGIGLLVFFNHFLGRNMTEDPTPMEIEMRTYEEDIQKTLIEAYGRKGKKSDVGSSDRAGSGGA
jgi:stage V sporulation protein AA